MENNEFISVPGESTQGIPSLANVPHSKTLHERLGSFLEPGAYDTTYLTHGIHPYAAKYIPQLPNLILTEHTNERHRILDPFCGSGTTLLEAALLGRKSVGIDSHPIAALVSRVKTSAISANESARLRAFRTSLEQTELRNVKAPRSMLDDARLRHWFAPHVIAELFEIKQRITRVRSPVIRDLLSCVMSSIIVQVSYQESETRYAAIEKTIAKGDTLSKFLQKLKKVLPAIESLSALSNVRRNKPLIINADLRQISSRLVADDSIDLMITSPPYPNSYDYYLYHKWRLWWLGFDVNKVKAMEIGSRHEHSSQKTPMTGYIDKMRESLAVISRVLKPSKLAYFFVGDAVVGGQLFDIREVFEQIVKPLELHLIEESEYSLATISRSFREKSTNSHGGARNPKKQQRILVFERVRNRGARTSNRTQAYPQASKKSTSLSSAKSGSTISIASNDADRHIHSLGRYPSKFIPEIPRWAILEFSGHGDTVMDPFVGSGTSGVEAVIAGRHFVGVDISPYSCLLTRAKTGKFDLRGLRTAAERLMQIVATPRLIPSVTPPEFPLAAFWFPIEHLRQLAGLKQFIVEEIPTSYRDFFLASLSTVVRACSYQDEGQIKVKRDPRKVTRGTPAPAELVGANLLKHIQKYEQFLAIRFPDSKVRVFQASADHIVPNLVRKDSIDLIVTSPPYINAMNYPMTHRYENFVLEFIKPEQKTNHEEEYMGTERVYSAKYKVFLPFELEFGRAEELEANLRKIHSREPKRSYIARRYFERMAVAIEQANRALKGGGTLVLVAGRNNIRQVPVDTFGYLVSIAESLGFKLEKWFQYEIIKNAFKLTRHATADIIALDGVAILKADK